ncbi:MAG: hypothetical protein GF418_08560 [Chitinivibrionales bacterium]|nr:hypothetical protein [Chitinivibrionales bacterium]MBD3395664.1 hypothetical protein [Chitinivibrionales bacterium]
MLLWIFAIVFFCALLAAAIIAFSPLRFWFEGSMQDQEEPAFKVRIYWLHPAVLRAGYDSKSGRFETVVLNRFGQKKPTEGPPQPSKPPGHEEEQKAPLSEAAVSPGPAEERISARAPAPEEDTPRRRWPRVGPAAEEDRAARPGADAPEPEKPGEFPAPGPPPLEEETEQPRKKRASLRQRFEQNRVVFLLRQKRLRRGVLRCIGSVLRAVLAVVRFERCAVRVRAGSDNPAGLGKAYGYFIGMRNALALHQRKDITLGFDPVFNRGEVFEFEGSIRAGTSLARVLYPVLVLVVTLPYLSAFLTWRRMKKRGLM